MNFKSFVSRIILTFLGLFVILIVLKSDASASSSIEGYTISKKGKAVVAERVTNSPEKPTLLFFGGSGERKYIENTVKILQDKDLLEDWNVICIAINKCDTDDVKEWRQCVEDAVPLIVAQMQEGKIKPQIYVDGFSLGGYGAYLMALALQGLTIEREDGAVVEIAVQEVTFLDGAVTNVICEAEIQNLLNANIHVVIYATTSEKRISQNSRELAKTFENIQRVTSVILDVSHGNALKEAYAEGLHQF